MVARLFDGCGVSPSGIMTSHSTSAPLVRSVSGKMRTGFSTQSELRPSACMVELPSKPHKGSCSRVGNSAYSLICVLPRRLGVGVYPSSQIYSSLYFVIPSLSSAAGARCVDVRPRTRLAAKARAAAGDWPLAKHFLCHPPFRRVRARSRDGAAREQVANSGGRGRPAQIMCRPGRCFERLVKEYAQKIDPKAGMLLKRRAKPAM